MTAGNEEKEPLLSSTEHHRVVYNANGLARESPFHLTKLNGKDGSEICIEIPRKDGGGGGGGGGGGYGSMLSPGSGDRVTYTWSGIDVFTEEKVGRQSWFAPWSRANTYMQTQRKQILTNVHGAAYAGELLAILGSSGAGKTTLLNALTFRTARGLTVRGARALDGIPATAQLVSARAAYVHQDDLFIGTLTVREHLVFQALVRMDRRIPYVQRMRRVNEVISELALNKCENTTIGIPGRLKGISGGEMKRLSFASEVLTDPPLLLCDEPTSGLDSFMAQNVVQVLKGLAQKGKTVVCTIHQPSSEIFAAFDKLLLMAEGRVAFLGTPREAHNFFREAGAVCPANYNPADHYMAILGGGQDREEWEEEERVGRRDEGCEVHALCDAFARSAAGERLAEQAHQDMATHKNTGWAREVLEVKITDRARASWCAQFRAVLWRSWLSVIKDPMLIKVRFIQTIMVAVLIGVIYFGQKMDQDGVMNINGAIFMFLTNMTFQNVFAVINVFCSELPVFLREQRAGTYRADVYFLCKTLAETPVFATAPLVFVSVSYYMVGLNPKPEKFVICAAVAALVANVATSFGYLISCVSSSVSMAVSIGPPIVIPFMLFGGFFLNQASVPSYLSWVSYLSWFRYGNEALLVNQWSDVESIACTRENVSCPSSGHVVLQTLAFSEDDFIMDVVNMVLLIIGFRAVAFLALLMRTRRKE